MSAPPPADVRLESPDFKLLPDGRSTRRRIRLLLLLNIPLAAWYFTWLLHPDRVGTAVLFGALVAAELFNLSQGIGFWWTTASERVRDMRSALRPDGSEPEVDVLIPTYDEPVEIVEPTIVAACGMRGARVHVALLDDGDRGEMRRLADRHGIRYIARPDRGGAKAGNLNHAIGLTGAPFVAVFDCDHVPDPRFLQATLGHLSDRSIAYVQTPQYYANRKRNPLAAAAWAQQALFFGAIARGKDGQDSIFCCGTNVVFRRRALEDVDGFPEGSLTEDFDLSVRLHEHGWTSAYVPRILARGLGPEDMASYVSQQQRWARGCISAIPGVLRARLPWRLRLQYLLSGMYFLSGWTLLIYMSMPVIRLLTGEQPIADATSDEFLVHFAPYFSLALLTVVVAGAGAYTFRAFALAAASFWLQIWSSILSLLRIRGTFAVTPKRGAEGRQPLTVLPALVAIAVLLGAAGLGLATDRSPSTLNNVAFVALHVSVLTAGILPALQRTRRAAPEHGAEAAPATRRLPAPLPAASRATVVTSSARTPG